MAKWQRFKINVRKDLGPLQRQAVGLEVIEHIKKRTSQGKDKSGTPWKGKAGEYSKSYRNSLDFKIAKGRSRIVNLELSSEMMNSMKVLSNRSGELLIGYDKGDQELNGKVEGNRIGSYGGNPNPSKARDFLGIEKSKLIEIENKYDFKIRGKAKVNERIERVRTILGDT